MNDMSQREKENVDEETDGGVISPFDFCFLSFLSLRREATNRASVPHLIYRYIRMYTLAAWISSAWSLGVLCFYEKESSLI